MQYNIFGLFLYIYVYIFTYVFIYLVIFIYLLNYLHLFIYCALLSMFVFPHAPVSDASFNQSSPDIRFPQLRNQKHMQEMRDRLEMFPFCGVPNGWRDYVRGYTLWLFNIAIENGHL